MLAASRAEGSDDERWRSHIESAIRAGQPPAPEVIDDLTGGVAMGSEGAASESARLRRRLLGLGPLHHLVEVEGVTDVVVNGDGSVWLDAGDGLERTTVVLAADESRHLATRLAGLARKRLDDAQPWVDAVLPSGVRLHAILPPLAEGGTHMSLRVPREQPAGVHDLQRLGAVNADVAEVLRALLHSRASFVIVGGTGCGKTTVLGALLADCDPGERIVIVEDVRELAPRHPHVVRLQGRMPNVEGVGAVTMVDLVRQSLRMRPDRVVVGEVRGAEVRELLAALNTGHEGGAGTMHANGIHEVPARFEALGALAGLDRGAVHAQLRGAVEVVVEVSRSGAVRYVSAIGVTTWQAGEVSVEPALSVAVGDAGELTSRREHAWPRLSSRLGASLNHTVTLDGPS